MLAACQTEVAVGSYAGVAHVQAFKMDLSDEGEVAAAAARLKEELPGGLYCLVCNNNNTVVGKDGLVEWMGVANYELYVFCLFCHGTPFRRAPYMKLKHNHAHTIGDRQMEVNLYRFVRATKAFLPLLKVRDSMTDRSIDRFGGV